MKPLAFAPNLVDQVYEAVLDAICSGRLAPGEPVVQEQVAETLNVSRQPVVQALVLLKKQGFVEPAGRKGHRVAPLDPKMARRVYAIRGALDRLAAREAARNPAAEAELSDALEKGRALLSNGTVADLIAADVAFHQAIYDLAGNPLIAQTADVHWRHIRRLMGAVLRDGTQRESVWSDHAMIADAIIARDADLAASLAEQHVTGAADYLIAQLEQDLAISA